MKQDVIELDGAIGGGQVLRSGLSLSMVTGLTLRIKIFAPSAAGQG